MKRKNSFLMLFVLIGLLHCSMMAYASNINIDNGGGGYGGAVTGYTWGGQDGVRVTVIRVIENTPVTTPIDLCNQKQKAVKIHFGKHSKLSYKQGTSLSPKSNAYRYARPSKELPEIIGGNLEEIKRYFCSEYAAMAVAEYTGLDYEDLTSGEYKLLIEPIAYAKVGGVYMAMTAHEAALYDEILGGTLQSRMPSLTHKNLPLSMFLTTEDLGIGAWTGSQTGRVSNNQIKNYLGAAVVKYKDILPQVEIETEDVIYHCDTDVVTSVYLSSDVNRTPDNPISLTFSILGMSYQVAGIVIPAGSSQLVWCKWHTPDIPQTIPIQVGVSGGNTAKATLTAKITRLKEKVPPNPSANDSTPDRYTIPANPALMANTRADWSVWNCYWKADWKWVSDWQWISTGKDKKGNPTGYWVDYGYWFDFGKWEYDTTDYFATMSAAMSLTPDGRTPTASGTTMKSGYGVNCKVDTTVSSNGGSNAITGVQNVITYFPEFQYKAYWRILEPTVGGYSSEFQFKKNKYSTYNERKHFSPIWYPDGTYNVNAKLIDMWTPTGMLSCTINDAVRIEDALYADWHIAPKE